MTAKGRSKLLLAGSLAAAVLFSSGSAPGQTDLTEGIKEKLRSVLQLSAGSLRAVEERRDLIEVRQPGLPFGSVRGYDPTAVVSASAEIQRDLLAALNEEEQAALASYVERFFPETEVRTLTLELDSKDAAPPPVCSSGTCPEELADPESVAALYGSIYQFVEKVAGATAYRVSFRVRSQPTGARFTMTPIGGGLATEIATDSSIGNVFRGLYQYEVKRAGYKTAGAVLNLVDNDPEELYCQLVPEEASEDPLPCLFGQIHD